MTQVIANPVPADSVHGSAALPGIAAGETRSVVCYRLAMSTGDRRLATFHRTGKPFIELISAQAIAARVGELGADITRDYHGFEEDVVVLGVLKGSVIFMSDLVRAIGLPVYLDFIGIASYGDATVSSGVVQITHDLTRPIEGRHVLIVEDIIDTGHTAHYLIDNLMTRRPASIKLCALLHKPERAERSVAIDYLGFTIPNKFVVGYGLDVAQQYRNLPFIGHVDGA
jgi:hypoxanthine phosphoribosyltransferase